MEPIYSQTFSIDGSRVDCFGRAKTASLLYFIQEVSGRHSDALGHSWQELAQEHHLFWAVVRHRMQISRLPVEGETITVETWPCPTTRVAYPRSVIARDERGEEVFRAMSLWVLMNTQTRAMIRPGMSGVEVPGLTRGNELAAPASLLPVRGEQSRIRPVHYADLDKNGHMNNIRYLDWSEDLLPSAFHGGHTLREAVICYLSEAREGETLRMDYALTDGPLLRVDFHRDTPDTKPDRICAIRAEYT